MNDDKTFILEPDRWPNWPFLPVKKSQERGFPLTGTLVAADDCRFTVFDMCIFSLPSSIEGVNKLAEYKTVDELLADGWRVD